MQISQRFLLKQKYPVKAKWYQKNATLIAASTNINKQSNRYTFLSTLLCLCFVLNSESVLACSRPLYNDQYTSDQGSQTAVLLKSGYGESWNKNKSVVNNIVTKNIKTAWGGWTPKPSIQREWHAYYIVYYKNKTKNIDFINKKNKEKLQKERGPGSGWPDEPQWQDLGEGRGGLYIPDWAYVPWKIGKPECLEPPQYGKCKDKPKDQERYGFNPYMEECVAYTWSGCGGSLNNFDTKLRCIEFCTLPPPPSCDNESGIPISKDYIYFD